MIAIIDYGVGNLSSVKNMIRKTGFEAVIASDETYVKKADKIILPGIGAFDYCMQMFNNSGLRQLVSNRVIYDKVPLLGICVGLQMLMESSEEGTESGLGWISGKTVKFKREKLGNLKVPHMGWTDVILSKPSELTTELGDNPRYYFVHSYHVVPDYSEDELLIAKYAYPFVAGINRDNIYGVQFHPEKSHRFGMKLLENFAKL